MRLDGLIPLYRDMRNKSEAYCTFDFRTNGKSFEVFFDIYQTPFKLIFMVVGQNYRLCIDVEQGFVIVPILSKAEYKELARVLELTYDPDNPFSPPKFFRQFNQSIPSQLIYKVPKQSVYRFYKSEVEDVDRIYYLGKIEWGKLSGSTGNVSEENLFKTRLLFPELYETCKSHNISIKYTANKKEEKDFKPDFSEYR